MMYSNNPRRQVKALGNDIARLRADVRKLGGSVGDLAGKRANEVHDSVGGRIREQARGARAQGVRVRREAEAELGRHPFTTVLVAAGFGFVTAAMLSVVARRRQARRRLEERRLPEESRGGNVTPEAMREHDSVR